MNNINENYNYTPNGAPQGYPGYDPNFVPPVIPPKKNSKKVIGIVAACVAVLILVFGYIKANEDVFKVQDAIESIGTVTLDSKDDIEYAESAYNNLSSSEQGRVNNYDVLVESKKEYNELLLDSFESSEIYGKIKSIMYDSLGSYNPQFSFDRENGSLIITLSIDSSIEEYVVNYPSLARSSWNEVTQGLNGLTETFSKLTADYGIDVEMKLYPEYSQTLMFHSKNGVKVYDIID